MRFKTDIVTVTAAGKHNETISQILEAAFEDE